VGEHAHWFVLSQTEGEEYHPPAMPEWNEQKALEALNIQRVEFEDLDGNTQGYAKRGGRIAVSPIAALPHKTLFHEIAHLCGGQIYVLARSEWREGWALFGLGHHINEAGLECAEEFHKGSILMPAFAGLLFGSSYFAFGKSLGLHLQVDLRVNIGGAQRDVSQPGSDRVDINSRS
jgi:hypothetical protein